MATITDEDRAAAVLLTGTPDERAVVLLTGRVPDSWSPPAPHPTRKPDHANVRALVGANACQHEMCGSGEPVAALLGKGFAHVEGVFDVTPYRHHEFSQDPSGPGLCLCGNRAFDDYGLHTRCDI